MVAGWRAAFPPGRVTTSAAAQWHRGDHDLQYGTSSCRYRCRLRRAKCRASVTWRALVFGAPCQHSLPAGREHGRDQCSEASCHSSGWKSRQQRSPDTVVVISSDGEGDRSVESLEVKAPVGWETGQIRTGGPAT